MKLRLIIKLLIYKYKVLGGGNDMEQVLNLQKLPQNEAGDVAVAWTPITLTTLWSTQSSNC